ncbi:MAG: vitamin K epoxide reductase family protein [Armatimonadota bacterium]|nr:vitamin K epoxide reductase family protein [Armatimonadota bacterium]MDR7436243.1 vitamin K epoxide reductase family protein [Armatimonadota bacterium]MDR7471377.1 vitamin K epoxide reductase family protein [Armatimonadota bacterium]MDR7506411.1 vitamin K epoxide reductase family protein [Armatimonadota bacterium]MDR7508966.1 vitamin K epoxide reductase family protein [Armatimonadota bacterium]
MAVLILGLAGAAVSAYVWYKQVTPGPVLCLGSGCAAVIRSRYGRLLGIPNGALGVAYFLTMAAVPLVESWWPVAHLLALGVTGVALILYVYLTYLQLWVLRTVCSWCLASAALTAAIFGALV